MSEAVSIVILATFVREKGGAVLIADAAGREIWLPRSQVTIEESMFGQLRITVPAWLAREKNIGVEKMPTQERLL